jgi:hypothetical protein
VSELKYHINNITFGLSPLFVNVNSCARENRTNDMSGSEVVAELWSYCVLYASAPCDEDYRRRSDRAFRSHWRILCFIRISIFITPVSVLERKFDFP